MITQEMKDHFEYRTKHHIKLVKNHILDISYLNLPDINNTILYDEIVYHDATKFKYPEYEPYLYINWKYYQLKLGNKIEYDIDINNKMKDAIFHHFKCNKHHPEYWDRNENNQDKPGNKIVDATLMPPTFIAVMVADWKAVAQELKTDINDWVDKNVNIRWKFTINQVNLINALVNHRV